MTASLDPLLADLMLTEVTVYQSVTRDAYGKRTLGAGTTVLAHISQGAGKVSDGDGEQVPIDATLYLADVLNVDPATDVVELPDGSRPRVVSSMVRYDEYGEKHHEQVLLTRSVD